MCYLGAPHEASRDLTSEPVSNLPDSLEGAAAPQSRGLLPGRQRALAYCSPHTRPLPIPGIHIPLSASVALTGSHLRTWCPSFSDSLTSPSIVPLGLGHVAPRDRISFLLKAE